MGRPARSSIPGSRPYTGFDGVAPGITGGLAQWIIEARNSSNRTLHSLGAYGVRPMRGKTSMSVHSTGRAVDLSYARKPGVNPGRHGRDAVVPWLARVVEHANQLGVEAILDYWPEPHGRGWMCDRQAWERYDRPTIGGAPGGTWLHIELSPTMAHDAHGVRAAFRAVFPEIHPQTK